MKSLLKYDFKKIFFSKASIIINIIVASFLLISFLILFVSNAVPVPSFNFDEFGVINQNIFSFANIYLFLAIGLAYLLVREYSDHTVRNKIITGHSKKKIFISKIIIGSFYLIVLMTIYYFLFLGAEVLYAHFKKGFVYDSSGFIKVLKFHGLQVVIAVLVSIVLSYLAMIIQKISFNIIAIVAMSIISNIFLLIISFLEIQKIFLHNIKYIFPMYYSSNFYKIFVTTKQDPLLLGIAATFGYIVIIFIVGIFTLEKRSVK